MAFHSIKNAVEKHTYHYISTTLLMIKAPAQLRQVITQMDCEELYKEK